MANTIQSSNMLLPIPVPGTDPGPDYSYNLNSCLTLVDSHDHTPGKGVQLTTASLNINSNLPFNGFFATQVAGVTFNAQSTAPANGTIYESGVDLFYVDGVGNNIQITSGGGVVGSPGSITNLTAPASVTYVAASRTFVFASDSTISANLDAASLIMRNTSPNSTFALTLAPPASLAANYQVTLPQLPLAKNFVTMDTNGTLAADSNVDNTTLQYSSNLLGIKASGVGTTQIANGAVTGAKLDTSAVAVIKEQTFTASGSFVVPPNTQQIIVVAVGGGGGGGGGAFSGGAATEANGGGGGAGGSTMIQPIIVTPGETLTVTVGGGGSGGAGTAVNGTAPGGNAGGDSAVLRSSTTLVRALGGDAGGGGSTGVGSPAPGAGGTGPSLSSPLHLFSAGGGNGSQGNNAGSAGSVSIYLPTGPASGGTTSASFGAGGGGGSGYAIGGNGGNSGSPGTNGGTAAANSGGGGGGGASGNVGGRAGGAGGSGIVIISYVGIP